MSRLNELESDAVHLFDVLSGSGKPAWIRLEPEGLDDAAWLARIEGDAQAINPELRINPSDFPRGWCALIACSLAALRVLVLQHGLPGLPVHRVKEKFGELRLVMDSDGTPIVSRKIAERIVEWAKEQSSGCCVVSGKPAEMLLEHLVMPLHPDYHRLYDHDRQNLRIAMRVRTGNKP